MCLYDVNTTYLAQFARSQAVFDKENVEQKVKSSECCREQNRLVSGLLASSRPVGTSSSKRYMHAHINFNI